MCEKAGQHKPLEMIGFTAMSPSECELDVIPDVEFKIINMFKGQTVEWNSKGDGWCEGEIPSENSGKPSRSPGSKGAQEWKILEERTRARAGSKFEDKIRTRTRTARSKTGWKRYQLGLQDVQNTLKSPRLPVVGREEWEKSHSKDADNLLKEF